MLALTPTAAEVVDSIVSREDLPETAGLRIASVEGAPSAADDGTTPKQNLQLSIVEQPKTGDELVEGSHVFVEPGDTADLLDDKVLDADVSEGEVRFSLLQQTGPEPS